MAEAYRLGKLNADSEPKHAFSQGFLVWNKTRYNGESNESVLGGSHALVTVIFAILFLQNDSVSVIPESTRIRYQ